MPRAIPPENLNLIIDAIRLLGGSVRQIHNLVGRLVRELNADPLTIIQTEAVQLHNLYVF
jgi:hypothetical protein